MVCTLDFTQFFLPAYSANTNAHNQVDDLLKPSVAQFCDACTNTTLAGACIRALPENAKKSTDDPYYAQWLRLCNFAAGNSQ
jgi:hypothetical protein